MSTLKLHYDMYLTHNIRVIRHGDSGEIIYCIRHYKNTPNSNNFRIEIGDSYFYVHS